MYHFWVKTAAFFLAVVTVALLVFSAFSAGMRYGESWEKGKPFEQSSICRSVVTQEAYGVAGYYENFGAELLAQAYPADNAESSYRFVLRGSDDSVIYSNAREGDIFICAHSPLYFEDGETVESYMTRELAVHDDLYWAAWFYGVICDWGDFAAGACIASLLVFLFLVLFLSRASGRKEDGTLAPSWPEKIPFDLYLFLLGMAFAGLCAIGIDMVESSRLYLPPVCLAGLACIALCTALVLAAWMSLCVRVKLGTWWRNTLIFYALKLCWRILKFCLRALAAFGKLLLDILRGIPLVWKTALGSLVLWLFVFALCSSNAVGLAILVALLVSLLTCAAAMQLRRLQKGGAALAAGDFETKIPTKHMYWDFKRHAENLNSVGEGMSLAVEKQLKSERLKTELITNVSHDIKTPLTSIINYVDLLQREHTPEQEKEYLDVLKRQSFKLKKLTEDLVEASKASTGNLAVNRSRCSMNELLQQAAGEYSERLGEAGLSLLVSKPEKELFCYVDGSLMWRMMDNLMSNICKYAQSGTRVYLSLEEQGKEAVLTFKNVSRAALNIPAEELMERFVRGDSSRTTEGNGLGLSITRSLCELQGGTMTLSIDGDLFKVTLRLPATQ